jgi:hypothetical protein
VSPPSSVRNSPCGELPRTKHPALRWARGRAKRQSSGCAVTARRCGTLAAWWPRSTCLRRRRNETRWDQGGRCSCLPGCSPGLLDPAQRAAQCDQESVARSLTMCVDQRPSSVRKCPCVFRSAIRCSWLSRFWGFARAVLVQPTFLSTEVQQTVAAIALVVHCGSSGWNSHQRGDFVRCGSSELKRSARWSGTRRFEPIEKAKRSWQSVSPGKLLPYVRTWRAPSRVRRGRRRSSR